MNLQNTIWIKQLVATALLVAAMGCGSKDAATTTALPGESGAITAESEQQTIILNQMITNVDIHHNEMEPIFETRVQTQCHTEYQQRCNTQMERQCNTVQFPVCTTQSQNVCRDVPDRVCHTEQVPVCQNVPRRVCSTVQKCETVNDRVCRGTPPNQTCTNIPRRVCSNVEQCRTETSQVCHTESRQRCETINRRVCQIEQRQVCHNESRQECRDVPRQVCQQVPQQVCGPVATQVKVGERLRLHQLAQVQVRVVNPMNRDVSRDEVLLTLINGQVTAVARSPIGNQLQVREVSRQVVRLNETEERITIVLEVFAL